MTNHLESFDDAVEQALKRGENYRESLTLVRDLTRSLARSVQGKTGGLVSVDLMAPENLSTLNRIASVLDRKLIRGFGDDPEDKQGTWYVVATVPSGQYRILWRVELDSTGWPVVLEGPAEDESMACFTQDDLRREFIRAAAHGTVGRKLTALKYPEAQKDIESSVAAMLSLNFEAIQRIAGQLLPPAELPSFASAREYAVFLQDWVTRDPDSRRELLSKAIREATEHDVPPG